MDQPGITTIVQAQKLLMGDHDVTSETALGLLVWAATDQGVTVLEVASVICDTFAPASPNHGARVPDGLTRGVRGYDRSAAR